MEPAVGAPIGVRHLASISEIRLGSIDVDQYDNVPKTKCFGEAIRNISATRKNETLGN
jgi:hypothetical protein